MKALLLLLFLAAGVAAAQDSPHGPISIPCETCHSTETWALRTDASFNHNSTGFPLLGHHLVVACSDCHRNLVFAGTRNDCASCHSDIHRGDVGTNCVRCHSMDSWNVTDITQKHQQTRFPLLGAHVLVNCDACHVRASEHRYAGTPLTCISCHRQDYQATTSPNHVSAGFSVDCAKCHRVDAMRWPGGFDHALTSFPLTGAHASLICSSCHPGNQFSHLSTDCFSCHSTDFSGTTSPNHAAGQFSHDCLTCHTTIAWSPATFNHSATRFALTGAHQTTDCQSCHTGGNYNLVYTGCYTCHQSNFTQSVNPAHVSRNFSHDCTTCHTTLAWKPASFDHSTTNFALTGAHVATPCASCHTGDNFQLVFADCYTCHQTDYARPTDPNHVTAQLNKMCTPCHTTLAWTPATFDHSTTKFALTGKHSTTPCQSCHVSGNYQIVYQNCFQCHQNDFQTAANPNHVAGQFSHTCEGCHSTTSWSPATFDHNTTKFALTGKHATTQCQSCHVSGNYQLVYSNCYQCHQGDYTGTTNPNHTSLGFSHSCESCHSTTDWSSASFDHSTTKFALTGAHVTTPCASCHTGNNFMLVYVNCYQCHQTNYTGTTNPNHVSNNFSQDCTSCHTTIAWSPATFDHSTTKFPLTGAHVATLCAACHTSNNYKLVYSNCYQCHQTDFTGTTNPNHVTNSFSQTCTTCHTTIAWSPASFDHSTTKFPLTGTHITTPCISCHTGGNYQLAFTNCYQCHSADYAKPTNPNHVTANFGHDCTPCHTTVAWTPSTFNHDTQYFKIYSGHHNGRWTLCTDCHTNAADFSQFSCINCHTHNQTQTNSDHRGVSGYIYASPNCYSCHRNS
jgi:hypothetical protein